MSFIEAGQALGDYVVKKLISSAPLGEVYFAFDEHNNKDVVITLLAEAVCLNDPLYQQLKEDFNRLKNINNPLIPHSHNIIEEKDFRYFVSNIPQNTTCLSDVIKSGNVLAQETAISVIRKIAAALEDIWENHGAIHSSLRPENILVNEMNEVYILNFGLEESVDSCLRATVESSKNLRKHLNLNRYRCPVMAQTKEYSCRSDMYSLGICFYEILTADEPFISTESAIVTHLLHDESKIDNLIKRDFPINVIDLIASMIATDPELRPKRWHDVVKDLDSMKQSKMFKTLKAPDKEIVIESNPQPSSVFIISIVILIMALILFLLSILLTNKLLTMESDFIQEFASINAFLQIQLS